MSASTLLHPTSTIRRAEGPLTADMNGELVMMDMEKGCYYGLDPIGSRIWQLLDPPITFAALCDQLSREYEVDQPTCEAQVSEFVAELRDEGLVVVEP